MGKGYQCASHNAEVWRRGRDGLNGIPKTSLDNGMCEVSEVVMIDGRA